MKKNTNKKIKFSISYEDIIIADIYSRALLRTFKNINNNQNIINGAKSCMNFINHINNTKFNYYYDFDYDLHKIYLVINENEWNDKIIYLKNIYLK